MAADKARVVIAGGGIGGLAASVALARQGVQAQLFEQAQAWTEVGAGIQVGPNVTRILRTWDVWSAVQAVAAFPQRLVVRDAATARELGSLRFDGAFAQSYGASYITIHRADLHQLLCDAAQQVCAEPPVLQQQVQGWQAQADGSLAVHLASTAENGAPPAQRVQRADVLIGADGLWSKVRAQLLPDEPAPRYSGILAYRALVPQDSLPMPLRSQEVTAWFGEGMHMVQYPVRGGTHLNVVALVQGARPDDLQNWDHSANAADLRRVLAQAATPVRDMAEAIAQWRLWPLCDRPPVQAAQRMAQGAVALLGDAAHPMRPFMAQGACMAIEDAAMLAQCVQQHGSSAAALQAYAQGRWQRCSRVQQRSIRNGQIFHSTGLMRIGRNLGMALLGERLLDVPWLYGYRLPA